MTKCLTKFKALGICAAIIVLIASTAHDLASSNGTRGLRVTARDTASGGQKELKIYNKSYAVLIGIDQYQNLKFDEQLAYAVRDAKGVEQVIRKNFKFDKVITLYNRDATKDNIMKTLLGELTREVGEEDALFVFWAGHGYTEKTSFGDLGYLVPFDGSLNPVELYKNISMTTLKDDISKKVPAKHVFYVMDACYSGLLATTRGATRQSGRDYNYLQEITKEKVRQVLTAGDKGQEVLDGGPKGHSVFTGRFIEILENTDDWITASEIGVSLREKVFSDARARNHTQTPRYGELFGVGDFVFVPSLEQKVEDTQAKVAGLQKELEQLKATEAAAIKAQDERGRRQAELEKRAVEAKLKAEQLRQQSLDEERRKKEAEEQERKQKEVKLAMQKKEDEERLSALKREVEDKRKTIGGTTLSSLSPEVTLTDIEAIDVRIKEIRESFRKELAEGIKQVSSHLNDRFQKLASARKDEFESESEFQNRLVSERKALERDQTSEFAALEQRIQGEYNRQVTPFLEQLGKLSKNEFTLIAGDLTLELGTYHATSNTYPVTIRSKQPLKGLMVAASANIPIPRDEAREFKLHFENNMLRPEIKGNFESKEFFRIAQARVIDDATSKQYDLFSSKFVDLGNGVVYDTVTKLLWLKDTNYFRKDMYYKDAIIAVRNLAIAGLSGWRLPSVPELERMFTVYHKQEPHPFVNFSENSYYLASGGINNMRVHLGSRGKDKLDYYWKALVWPVRGE